MSEHTHTYTHDHEGGDSEHTHDHEHDHHGHEHHEHSHDIPESRDKIVALLDYTLGHNRSHEDELLRLKDKLRDIGEDEAASRVEEAADSFSRGNELLDSALKLIKENHLG